MDSGDTFQFIILIILLMLSAFFSSNETALTTVNKIRLRSLADDGNKKAAMVLDITENHTSKMLSAILIGNNIVNISASSLSATLAYAFGGYMVSIATAVLTVAILVFGEITPKNYATINAEKISMRYIRIIRFFMTIMTPVIFIINLFSRGIMFLLRVDPAAAKKVMTEEELRTIVDVSHERGVIESDEKEMINNVFDLGDADAKDIMVPRVHVTFADVNSTYDELIDIFREDKFTRLPVYEDSQDNIVGIINMKDLLLCNRDESFNIRDIMRQPHFTYEYKSISELLVEMRESTFNIAIVLDEYGEMAGLITLEDILEEIVGEIHDEYDEQEDQFYQLSDREYVIEGAMNLDDVNERLQTGFASEDYDSLGGFIIEHLDRLPELNDEVVTEDGIRLVVETLDKNRIESVHVYLPEKTEGEEGAQAEPDDSSSKDSDGDSTSENISDKNADAPDNS
ncbi:HlyC/CorC family transporter [Mediterraneibacter glycyrrhizinilyticus]|uniref:Hemolysin family protein n=1 Tax=Candidatus Mediterraneibacter faecipullorum TaxID=2838670 RepID=A0A9D2NIQ4_9FIRM|nr:HlyC/CorC family transporter [Mediterraneibacter glycyrrhizinilyticus]HJC33115.1 hemolysin family protein [Candidatus Mediterraneibacter faecipullorum]